MKRKISHRGHKDSRSTQRKIKRKDNNTLYSLRALCEPLCPPCESLRISVPLRLCVILFFNYFYSCSNFFTPDLNSHVYVKNAMTADSRVKSHKKVVSEMTVLSRNA